MITKILDRRYDLQIIAMALESIITVKYTYNLFYSSLSRMVFIFNTMITYGVLITTKL